jgi:hypothetical protein
LRIYARHEEDQSKPATAAVTDLLLRELTEGMLTLDYYTRFGMRVSETKREILQFLIRARDDGKRVVGYGAPGKGNTLLNYCGIRTDFLDYTVDRNPHKHGWFLPGTLIPIHHPDKIKETRPDYIFILPWNLKEEIMSQLQFISAWDGKFLIPIPYLTVVEPSRQMASLV